MCRHLAYVGPPRSLASLLFTPAHSLAHQSTGPTRQREGATNLHGWGVGWWEAPGGAPERYRTHTPILDDGAFRAAAERTEATALLAAVRNASPGATIDATGNAPFAAGPWLFSLNGYIDGYRTGIEDELRSLVTPGRAAGIEGDADSEVLFALLLDALDAGAAPREALRTTVDLVVERTSGKLNLLLADGHTIWATAHGNSLSTLQGRGLATGGVLVASEPLDGDPGWVDVPDDHILEADPTGISIRPRTTDRELT